ncbi:hypothetical protein [Parvularcula marina]|uniref:Uncharacterized protein n=1 Tax=Parvularcula marina TaxID=2292771 RepID=A0A371RHB9_9PROT|nr:hypothetical protein [Parvularcula marina]RFB04832.1 hypothetical protein DX908_05780 [Parvularcula marina]
MKPVIGWLAALAAAFSCVHAQTVDQEQPLFDTALPPQAIGGSSEQKLAQTFTVGVTGGLTAIEIPVGCSDGQLTVEIQGQTATGEPNGIAQRRAIVNADEVPPPPDDFVRIHLPTDLPVRAGARLALVLTNTSGTCGLARAPAGETYSGGGLFFDARPNPPGWISNKTFFGPDADVPLDLPFRTLMATGARGGADDDRCTVITNDGPQTLPIPDSVPLCRCLEDAGARELRCRLIHPDFLLTRRIQTPFEPGSPFEEEWMFTPLKELKTPVMIELAGAGLDKPARHVFGKKSKPGTFERWTVKGIAPKTEKTLGGVATVLYEGLSLGNSDGPVEFRFDRTLPDSALGNWPELMSPPKP